VELFQQMQWEGMILLFECSMHVQGCKHLKRADASIHRSYSVTVWIRCSCCQ
jgi:hypothetical protein